MTTHYENQLRLQDEEKRATTYDSNIEMLKKRLMADKHVTVMPKELVPLLSSLGNNHYSVQGTEEGRMFTLRIRHDPLWQDLKNRVSSQRTFHQELQNG